MQYSLDRLATSTRSGNRNKLSTILTKQSTVLFSVTTVVICYILFGLKKAKEFGGNVNDAEKILSFLTKAEALRRCELEKDLPQLITDIQASVSQVPSYFRKSKEVSRKQIYD